MKSEHYFRQLDQQPIPPMNPSPYPRAMLQLYWMLFHNQPRKTTIRKIIDLGFTAREAIALVRESKKVNILFATPAYSREYSTLKSLMADWNAGKDFAALDGGPWIGGPYFSIRDIKDLKNMGYRWINIRFKNMQDTAVIRL